MHGITFPNQENTNNTDSLSRTTSKNHPLTINTHYYCLNLVSVAQVLFSLLSPHLVPMLAISKRIEASLASLLIPAQKVLYAVKVASIVALLVEP
jgi:hypothetical protein